MKISLLGILLMLFTSITHAGISVVVHPSNDSVFSVNEIKAIYLGKTKTFPNGQLCIPVNLDKDSAARTEFESGIVGKTKSQMKAYWSRLVFTGKANFPQEVKSDQEIIDLISKNQNTIGYIESENVSPDVKVIYTQ